MDPAVRMYATSGRFYMATDYVKAQRLRLQLQAELEAALSRRRRPRVPVGSDADPEDRRGAPRLGGRELMWFEYGTVNLGNLTGAPALSLPCGFTPDGMPVGLQLYGRAFDEARSCRSPTPTSRRRTGTGAVRPRKAAVVEPAAG